MSTRVYRVCKRTQDVAVATLVLVAAAPLLIAVALAVRFTLGRPVLFRHERAGRHGVPFPLVKFRTMREASVGASERERLTPLGIWLRRTSLDELPQLWTVLRGDMSLVGPRPLPTTYLPRYSAEQRRRHDVKPGITGHAQINGRNALTWEEKFALDLWYVDHWSLGLDLRILARTVGCVLRRADTTPRGAEIMNEFLG